MDIKGKHILLTGASGGIGRAIAQSLAHMDAKIVLIGRDPQKLELLRGSLTNPEHHICLSADLTTPEGMVKVDAIGKEYKSQGNRIDIVINNAGINHFQFLEKRSASSITQEMQLNLLSPIEITQSALAWLNCPGIVLNIGSTFGSIGYPGYATYCAAKAGMQRFSEAMNRELDGSGIKVVHLSPRATDTELNSDAVNELNKKLGNHSDTPETVAKYVVDMIENEKPIQWIGWPEKFIARFNQIFPSVVSSSIRKQQVLINEYINKTNHA